MKIASIILGTRGDVQPMVALATGLISRGHKVVILASPEHEELVTSHSVEFLPFGPEIKKKIRENPEKQKGGVAVKISPKEGKKFTIDQMSKVPELVPDADLILGTGIVMGVHTAADILKIPYRLLAYYPVILGPGTNAPAKDRMMFGFGRSVINSFSKGYMNKYRKSVGLPPISDVWTHWMGEEVIMASDPEVSPVSPGVAFPWTQTGFMLLPSEKPLPEEIESFINQGTAPVYIGFGSNPITDPEKYTRMFDEVCRTNGRRLIVSKGWAGLKGSPNPDILFVDEVPFEKLFPHLSAIVYHGGTGTLAAAVRAGIPQAIFPFMGDQFANQKQAIHLGIAPPTCTFKKMTAATLTTAIKECLSNPEYAEKAAVLAGTLKESSGIVLTISYIEGLMKKKR